MVWKLLRRSEYASMKSRTKLVLVLVAILLSGEGWLVMRFLSGRRSAESQNTAAAPGESAALAPAVHCLDLSPHFNDSLDDGWQHQLMPGNNLGTLPRGRQVFGGVAFDVHGIIQLASPQLRRYSTRVQFPEQVRGIQVGRKCGALHFLQATGWNAAPGTSVGSYVIHYAGGEKDLEPIFYGQGTGNWWAMPAELKHPGAGVVWQGTNAANHPVQLFKQSWTNPRPDLEIESVDFESRMTRVAPFLIAMTAE